MATLRDVDDNGPGRTGGQLKAQETTFKVYIDWAKISSKLAQDRQAYIQEVINYIGDAGSTRLR